MQRRDFLLGAACAPFSHPLWAQGQRYDLVIYGATVAGISAAITMGRAGKSALLIQASSHFGGMTTGGLSNTDKGDESTIGGLADEFYKEVGRHYGQPVSYNFEPSVAESILRKMLAAAKPGRVDVVVGQRLDLANGVRKRGNRIESIRMESGQTYRGLIFMDASYEGDLMAKAGVDYHWGRESRAVYGEPLAGITIPGDPVVQRKQYFPKKVSAFRKEGVLLPGISDEPLGKAGDGDRKVQAYCFRLCVTDDSARRVGFHKPDGYDPWQYELLARMIAADPLMAVNDKKHFHHELLPARWLPNRKSDVNDGNPAATDYIGANWGYAEGDHKTRERIWQDHVNYTQGYLWFIANDVRVPEHLRVEASRYGFDAGEFGASKHFPPQLYIREGRRMVGAYVVSQKDCKDHPEKEDSIGVATYPVDSHHAQRIVFQGQVTNEGNFNNQSWGIFAHEVPYRAITPKREQCGNLFVPVCLGSSHVAYGSIRMEPVFMILGQSAALAAQMAIEAKSDVQQVAYPELRRRLLAQDQILSRKDAKGAKSSNLA